ncbi:MAG: hypothetical protein LQ342_000588 [Letrouitia transgressa]|nr:MAG: hypothetical protein LQ342_000588 [Letrouitia transgressa]
MVNEASSTSSESKRPTFHQTFSRLNLFSSKPTPTLTLEKPQRPLTVDLNDEWLTLDVHNALFSSGDGSPDPCSSTAVMKSQLQNAETLLSKLQIAYKARTQFLHEVIAEKEAQDEEVEVAQTRARHLKIQLDDTTQKMAEQDRAIMNLVDELAREKQARREEDDARKRSVLLIHNSAVSFTAAGDAHAAQQKLRTASNISYESSVSEDEVSLLFSPAPTASPTVSTASVSTMNSPELRHTSIDSPCPQQISQLQPVRMRPSLRVQSNNNSSKQRSPLGGQWKCYSCAEAWSVVEVLKSENQGLKERVEHLEGELDGCLDLVNGLVETTEAAPAKG